MILWQVSSDDDEQIDWLLAIFRSSNTSLFRWLPVVESFFGLPHGSLKAAIHNEIEDSDMAAFRLTRTSSSMSEELETRLEAIENVTLVD